MNNVSINKNSKEKNIFETLIFQYSPYWPLFLILVLLGGGGAYAYLKYIAKPVYEITAKVLVEDQKKGVDESKLIEILNISSKTIVDNELEVIQSKELLKEVIDSLLLCAQIFEEGPVVSHSAYTSSPISIELQNPKNIPPDLEKIYFTYNKNNNTVSIEGKAYPLDEFVKTSFGVVKFIKNPHITGTANGPLYITLSNKAAVLDNMANKLLVTPASKLSSVILLKYNDEVPARGEDILNSLIEAYYRAGMKDKNELALKTISFLQSRVDSVAMELNLIESKQQVYRNQNSVINLSEQGKQYLQNVGDNDRKMTDINIELAMLSEVEKYVLAKDNKVGIVPSMSGAQDQGLLNQLLQKLYDSQMEYERLKKTIPEGNPRMYSLKSEINNMRPAILENIQNQRANLLAGKNSLSQGTGRYVSMLRSIPKKEKDLLDMSRQQAIKNDAYSFLLQKKEEASLAYAAIANNYKTINYANASFAPVSPKKMFVFASALAFSLLLGFAFVHLKESFTDKILFRSDIENITSIPIAGEILRVKGKEPMLLSHKGPRQLSYIEQFYQLRFGMGLNNGWLKYKKILVTSAKASEGKSFISNNLALSLALSGKKVVLIDFDFRKPKTSTLYNLSGNTGLAEYFENEDVSIDEIIYQSDIKELFIIPAGVVKANPTELLINDNLDKLFAYLESNFDYVIMDTAPVDPIIDAFLVSHYSDAILFVIRHGYSTKAMLESLQKNNKMGALNNVFIVFNGIKPRGFLKKGYGYGYGYGNNNTYGEKAYQAKKLLKGA